MRFVAIGIAGALGALARYGIDSWISQRLRHPFPWGILAVNLAGCFLLGFTFVLLTERFQRMEPWRLPVSAGFLGAFTTFSTFAFQTANLAEDRMFLLAAANVIASVAGGIAAAWLGSVAGRALS